LSSGNYVQDEDGEWLSCDNAYQEGIVVKYDYHTDPHKIIGIPIPEVKYRFGAELEYKGAEPDYDELGEAMGDGAILTEDSSVSGEIVTRCLTMGELKHRLLTIADALHNTRNDSDTGLHFHADKGILTAWQWWQLIQYCKANADILHEIGGRDCWDYGSFKRLCCYDWGTFASKFRHGGGERYAGWGITAHTVELRVCRASKNRKRIAARFDMWRLLLALGTLPNSAKPWGDDLKGFLSAASRYIERETDWEPGDYSFKAAMRDPMQIQDQSPAQRATRDEIFMLKVRYAAALKTRYHCDRMMYQHLGDYTLHSIYDQAWRNESGIIDSLRTTMAELELNPDAVALQLA
jgi:hypothetical protein